ncbi:hypothetical protein VK792_18600 [Mesobacterium sp. TK19101]|uniref:Uncharacterized protein n=1 Tax=Mesobacterium hydrothermale TaxID=3111907 RepID=A0ABU6HPB3_9RHOB|nr:hypothetical protein [Mesobacterium sp. TK19101]MEC3863303.1 hypothetical protein [Mesobacterium sp. TK19101]
MSEASNPNLVRHLDDLDHALSRIRGSVACMEILAVSELDLCDANPAVSAFYSTLSGMEAFVADAQKSADELNRIRMGKVTA